MSDSKRLQIEKIVREAIEIPGSTNSGDLWEIAALAHQYIKEGGMACEVGIDQGRSAHIISSICEMRNATFYALDINPIPELTPNTIKIQGDSRETHTKVPKGLDFAFIDGNHDMPTVFHDIINFAQKIDSGGMLCGHDYHPDHGCDVKVVVDNLWITRGFNFNFDTTIWTVKR